MSLTLKARTIIDRRALWKSSLLGAAALLSTTWPISPSSAAGRSLASPASRSLGISARLVAQIARAFFDYELPNENAGTIAHSANSTLGAWRTIAALNLEPVDPAFSYPALLAEAEQLAKGASGVEE